MQQQEIPPKQGRAKRTPVDWAAVGMRAATLVGSGLLHGAAAAAGGAFVHQMIRRPESTETGGNVLPIRKSQIS